jgi:thioredoxin
VVKEDILSMENEEQRLPAEGQPPEVQEHPSEEESARPVLEKDLPGAGKPKKRKTILFAGIAVLILIAAALFYFLYLGSPGRQVLASVNGEKITVGQFNKEVEKIKFPERDMFKEEPQQFIEGMVLRLLLLQEAKKQGTTVPIKTYKDADKEALSPDEALVAEFMKNKFSTPPAVTREEIQEFYKVFKDRMEGKKLDQVAPMIEKIIQESKQREAFETFMGDLQKNAKLEFNQDRIKKIAAKPPDSNTDEEFKKALQSGKPTLVDFGANSCQPCRLLRPVLKEIDKEVSAKAQILVLDVYKYQKLASEYKVVFIPTLVFFDAKGKEVFRHVGVLEKEQIISKLKEIGMAS